MPLPNLVAFSGNFSRPSRTRSLAEATAAAIARRYPVSAAVYDLADLGPSFGSARKVADLDADARAVVDAIITADVLLVGSPVYKGTYTGLFKHLFDLLDPAALTGKPVVLTATGGSERHALVIEHQLRPLFSFFAAHTLPSGVFAVDRDFTDYVLTADAIHKRIGLTVDELAAFLPKAPVLAATGRPAAHGAAQSAPAG